MSAAVARTSRHARARRNQHGFTLLEAIVALVLISTVGMALFSWINRNLDTLARVQEAGERDRLVRNGLEWMDTVNPMAEPQGSVEFGPVTVEWDAETAWERRDGMTKDGSQSLYQLALYDTEVTVTGADDRRVEFTLRQVGYDRVRDFQLPF